jgi:hypothetical protein
MILNLRAWLVFRIVRQLDIRHCVCKFWRLVTKYSNKKSGIKTCFWKAIGAEELTVFGAYRRLTAPPSVAFTYAMAVAYERIARIAFVNHIATEIVIRTVVCLTVFKDANFTTRLSWNYFGISKSRSEFFKIIFQALLIRTHDIPHSPSHRHRLLLPRHSVSLVHCRKHLRLSKFLLRFLQFSTPPKRA